MDQTVLSLPRSPGCKKRGWKALNTPHVLPPQSQHLQAIRFRKPAAMRPILQRRAAARLAAALLTPFLPDLRQQPALAISATTMSGKTRPDTGCVLVSEPRVDKVGKAQD